MKWQAPIPQIPKQRDRKRCYTVWTRWKVLAPHDGPRTGGKIVWLTDAQLTFAKIKYPNKEFDEVLEQDLLEAYKRYINQTIE